MGSVSRDADTSNARAPFGDFMSISSLIDRPIAFQRVFVDLGVGVRGALMLSQAVYWSKRTKDPQGWFYKTQKEWEEETGLTRREQERSRKALTVIGVLEETLRGVPAKLHYRVNEEVLAKALLGDMQEVLLGDVLRIYQSTLSGLSKTGYMRAQRLGAEAEFTDYADVLASHGMVCGCCGEVIRYGPGRHSRALSFDHRIPLSRGGSHTSNNLQPAHVECNSRKGAGDQPSLPSLDKLDCLHEANQCVLAKQTITENTQETTSETTTENHGPTLKEREAEAFERFWSAGMRKVDKAQARPAFQRARKRAKLAPEEFGDMLVADVQRRLRLGQTGFDKLHPKTYLNNQRWEDELTPGDTTPSSTAPRGLDDGRQRQYQGTDDADLPDFLREGGGA